MRILIDHVDTATSWAERWASGVSDAVSGSMLLFLLGLVLIALAGARMERLEGEVAARPARAFALGLLGIFAAGSIAVALCVTIIGIPFAVVGALLAVFAAYAGVVAVLRTIGAALIGHRTQNHYLHLALGCLLLLVVGFVPWIGDLVCFAVGATGFGAVIGTRAAGLWPNGRGRPSTNGYAPA